MGITVNETYTLKNGMSVNSYYACLDNDSLKYSKMWRGTFCATTMTLLLS